MHDEERQVDRPGPANTGEVSFSLAELGIVDDPAPELIAAVSDVRAGRGDMDLVLGLFRATTLWVERESADQGQAVRTVQVDGLHWLPVFTSLVHFSEFCQASGRGAEKVRYGTLTGADVLDACLPALPTGTGVLLDVASDHVLPLPPVTGVVPASLAVDAARA